MAGNGEDDRDPPKTQVNLKLIPGVDGRPNSASWSLQPHRDRREGFMDRTRPAAPGAACQRAGGRSSGRRVVGAHHFIADLTLPYGRVVYDYNKQDEDLAEAAE